MEVKRNQWEGWLYLLPTIILLAIFTIYPLFRTFFMAFCENYNYMKDSWDSIGIANFRNIFTGPDFLKYLKTTCIIVFVSVPASIIISLLIAVGLNSIKKFTKLYQTIFFMPYVTNSIAIGMVFSVMFADDRILVGGGLFLCENSWRILFGSFCRGIMCGVSLCFRCDKGIIESDSSFD